MDEVKIWDEDHIGHNLNWEDRNGPRQDEPQTTRPEERRPEERKRIELGIKLVIRV